jgi:FkbH-like protein
MTVGTGEPIRLVVWDLDDTFWRGTLSEGGVTEFVEAHHRLVVDLARRGIMSSICSRNDFETVRAVLSERGVWDYFIFPSIDWSAKPHRIRALVEATQLRPETILFIDDNPSNRAAVAAEIPGLRVAAETFIAEIADHPHFRGKPDEGLTRLKQYKLLESRHAQRSLASDPQDFLRSSGIRVQIEIDLAPHYERIVELINRTNQLNFTKRRLSEDTPTAIRQLEDELTREAPWVRAGLLRVRDNFGDYGYCGFYAQYGDRLGHFCFSCRVLGFGVESWMYAKLGRPQVQVEGEVLVDLETAPQVDWIALERLGEAAVAAPVAGEPASPPLYVRGRCEVGLIRQYLDFGGLAPRYEGAYHEGLLELLSDSAVNMHYTSGSRWERARPELQQLGFHGYEGCRAFNPQRENAQLLFFAHRDFLRRPLLYRHKRLDFVVCLALDGYNGDLVADDLDEIVARIRALEPSPQRVEAETARVAHLRANYTLVEPDSEEVFSLVSRALETLLQEAPADALLMPVLMHTQAKGVDGALWTFRQMDTHRQTLTQTLGGDPRVAFIDASACIHSPDEIVDWQHYDRVVYYRMAKAVIERARARRAGAVDGSETRQSARLS